MQFKVHLLIISVIIIAVYIIAHILAANKVEPAQSELPVVKTSPYAISIENASWGLNCKIVSSGGDNVKPDNAIDIKENNVIYPVSRMCNGNSRCEIPLDSNYLGEPMAGCAKILEVEYRCYNIDRMRTARASDGVMTIDCDKQLNP